jgi:hypothetical protein
MALQYEENKDNIPDKIMYYKEKCIEILKNPFKSCVKYHCEHYNNNNLKPRKYHICSVVKIVAAFLKSFLDNKIQYVLLENNVLMTEYFFAGVAHILYINNEGFGIYGLVHGFINYIEDPFICATIINLIHEYYKKNKEKNNMNYVVENFPNELIQKTISVLIEKNMIGMDIGEQPYNYIELCKKVKLAGNNQHDILKYREPKIELLASFMNKWCYIDAGNYQCKYTKFIIGDSFGYVIQKIYHGDSKFLYPQKIFSKQSCEIDDENILHEFMSQSSYQINNLLQLYDNYIVEAYQQYFNIIVELQP